MAKYLIKTTETYRVDTVTEVEEFHEELKTDGSFELDSFGYKMKQVKGKGKQAGMILDEYCVVTVKKVYDDEKNPGGGLL